MTARVAHYVHPGCICVSEGALWLADITLLVVIEVDGRTGGAVRRFNVCWHEDRHISAGRSGRKLLVSKSSDKPHDCCGRDEQQTPKPVHRKFVRRPARDVPSLRWHSRWVGPFRNRSARPWYPGLTLKSFRPNLVGILTRVVHQPDLGRTQVSLHQTGFE